MVDFNRLHAKSRQKRAAALSAHVRYLRSLAIGMPADGCPTHRRNLLLELVINDRAAAAQYKRARELMGVE